MIKKITFFKKIIFFFQKPKITILFGENFTLTEKFILTIDNNLKIIDGNNLDKKDLVFLLNHSVSPILIFKNQKDIPAYKIKTIINNLPSSGALVFEKENNFNDQFKAKLSPTQTYSFSLNKKADITLADLHKNHGTNFKINHKGNSVPFWVKEKLDNTKALDILAAITTGIVLKKNLVNISQIIKEKY